MTKKNVTVEEAIEFSKNILRYTSPVTYLVMDAVENAVNKSKQISESGDLEDIKQEALKQEVSLNMSKLQAKVTQEIAIARRIDTAEEIIIEEYYDNVGECGVGIKVDDVGMTAGISGSGKRVTKRNLRTIWLLHIQ